MTTAQFFFLLLAPLLTDYLFSLLKKLSRISLNSYSINAVDDEQWILSIAWDHLKANNHCRGVNNYTDFYASKQWIQSKGDKQVVPSSCCILDHSMYPHITPMDLNCIYTPTSYNSHWMHVCFPALSQMFLNYSEQFLLLVLLLLIFHILLLLLGFLLYSYRYKSYSECDGD